MDSRLDERLTAWHNFIDVITKSEGDYLKLEANDKPMFSLLYMKSEGRTVAEKEAYVYSSKEWDQFKKGHIAAKIEYLRDKRKLELLVKAYEATYITYKIEAEAIRRAK